ncbi:MAG: hypothetical protein MUC36_10450 [Planctomycetes bacterium]|jgi:hypothetical protein|nr:hypothetical protein [Planctomycetota bacterium]
MTGPGAACGRWSLSLWLLAALAVAQAEVPRLRAELPSTGLRFGSAFELEVERTPAAVAAGAFDERLLQPLVVELLASRARGDGGEQRRYRARCFRTGAVALFDLAFEVKTSLPEPAGELEWPGPLRPLPAERHWLLWAIAGGALALGGLWWRRRAAAPIAAATQPPAPAADFAAALAALPLPGAADPTAFHERLKALLRAHCAQCGARSTVAATSEQLRASLGDPPPLRQALQIADGVLFAALRPADEVHEAARAAAIAFVRATAVAAVEVTP